MRIVHLAALLAISATVSATVFADAPKLTDSVVKITTTRRAPNVVQPWTKAAPSETSGTGFVIAGQRLLTNAHVIEYASQIYVQPNKSDEKYEAHVEAVSVDYDLAVLRVPEPGFFDARPPFEMGPSLPKAKTSVNVYGYPIGGEQQSVTEGIISRVEFVRYGTGMPGLRIQIDAALNPGNSGGPAVSNGKLVGVAFQVLQQAENVGYLIPVEEIQTFLADIEDGKYDGKPYLPGEYQTLENDAIRARLGLARGEGGAMLARSTGDPSFLLQPGDVILQVAGTPLDQTSRIAVTEDLMLPFSYLVPQKAQAGKITLRVKRANEMLDLEVPVVTREPELIRPLRGGYPSYFIYGPFVFSRATKEFVSTIAGRGMGLLIARQSPLLTRMQARPAFDGEELVVIVSPMFSHRITKGYSQPFAACLAAINGQPIRNLEHLVKYLKEVKDEFVEFDFHDRGTERIVFRRAEIEAATDEILSDNGIRKSYSDDLEPLWKGGP